MLNSPLWGLSCFPFPPRCERMCCHPLNLCQSDRWECQYRISIVLTCAFFLFIAVKVEHLCICLSVCVPFYCVCVNYWVVKKFVWVFPKNIMEKTWKNFLANQVFMFCSFHFNLYNKLRRANQYICSIEPSYSRENKIHFLMSIFMSFKRSLKR